MIMAALLEETFSREFAIGEKNLTATKMINHLLNNLEDGFKGMSGRVANRNLNHYIKSRIHGPVSLEKMWKYWLQTLPLRIPILGEF
jgi:uncharacterized protein YehS (DUF1456 family)